MPFSNSSSATATGPSTISPSSIATASSGSVLPSFTISLKYPISAAHICALFEYLITLPPRVASAYLHHIAVLDRKARFQQSQQQPRQYATSGQGSVPVNNLNVQSSSISTSLNSSNCNGDTCPNRHLLDVCFTSFTDPKWLDASSFVYSYFFNQFFARAQRLQLGNQIVSDWCLALLCIGYDADLYLRTFKSFQQHIDVAGNRCNNDNRTASTNGDCSCSDRSHHSGRSTRCQKQWNEGELAYACIDCQADPQCAVCVECFQRGNHVGHDYAMIVTGGGFCDCGDEQAWKPSGFCSAHSLGGATESISDAPLSPDDSYLNEFMQDADEDDILPDDDDDDDAEDGEEGDMSNFMQAYRRRRSSSFSIAAITAVSGTSNSSQSSLPYNRTDLPPVPPELLASPTYFNELGECTLSSSEMQPLAYTMSTSLRVFYQDNELVPRTYDLIQSVLLYVCRTMYALGAYPTPQRRFASVVKVLSWIRKLCRGGVFFQRALAMALITPFNPSDEKSYDGFSFTDEIEFTDEFEQYSIHTCLSFLFSFCTLPGPVISPSRLDRVVCEICVGLLSQVSSGFKPYLLSAYLQHYVPLHQCKSRLPSIISVQILAVPSLARHLLAEQAENKLITSLWHTLAKAANTYANRSSCVRQDNFNAQSKPLTIMPKNNNSSEPMTSDSIPLDDRNISTSSPNSNETTASEDLLYFPSDPTTEIRSAIYNSPASSSPTSILGNEFPNSIIIPQITIDCSHPLLTTQAHYSLKIDLIYLLRHLVVACSFLNNVPLFGCWLDILGLLQRSNSVKRVEGGHIEFETEEWQYAFELEHDMQQLVELLTKAFVSFATLHDPSSHDSLASPVAIHISQRLSWTEEAPLTSHPAFNHHHTKFPLPPNSSSALSPTATVTHSCSRCETAPRSPSPAVLKMVTTSLSMIGSRLQMEFDDDGLSEQVNFECIDGIVAIHIPQLLNVRHGWTSFHIPLHRMLARFATLALTYYRLPLHMLSKIISSPKIVSRVAGDYPMPRWSWWQCLIESPLRLQVVVAQMRAKLWVRNGDSVLGQQACYRSPSFSLPGLYSDLFTIQLAACNIPHDRFYYHLLDRFELTSWAIDENGSSFENTSDDELTANPAFANEKFFLQGQRLKLKYYSSHSSIFNASNVTNLSDSDQLILCEELLRFLVHLFTDRTHLSCDKLHVRAELLHALCVHTTPTHSSLLACLPESLSRQSQLVDSILEELAEFHPPQGTRGGTYSIKHDGWTEFNPFFFRYMPHELAQAEVRCRQHTSRTTSSTNASSSQSPRSNQYITLICPTPSPTSMSKIFSLLHSNWLHRLLQTVLYCAEIFYNTQNRDREDLSSNFSTISFIDNYNMPPLCPLKSPSSFSYDRLLSASFHLLTLAILTLPDLQTDTEEDALPLRVLPTCSDRSTNIFLPSYVSIIVEELKLLRSIPSKYQVVDPYNCLSRAQVIQSRIALCHLVHRCSFLLKHSEVSEHSASVRNLQLLAYFYIDYPSPFLSPMNQEPSASSNSVNTSNVSIEQPTDSLTTTTSNTSSDNRSREFSKERAKQRQAFLLEKFASKQRAFQESHSKTLDSSSSQHHRPSAFSTTVGDPTLIDRDAKNSASSHSDNSVNGVTGSSHHSADHPQVRHASDHSSIDSPFAEFGLDVTRESECCLCREPAAAARMLGLACNIGSGEMMRVNHRQQCKALTYRLLNAQLQSPPSRRVRQTNAKRRTNMVHSFPSHHFATNTSMKLSFSRKLQLPSNSGSLSNNSSLPMNSNESRLDQQSTHVSSADEHTAEDTGGNDGRKRRRRTIEDTISSSSSNDEIRRDPDGSADAMDIANDKMSNLSDGARRPQLVDEFPSPYLLDFGFDWFHSYRHMDESMTENPMTSEGSDSSSGTNPTHSSSTKPSSTSGQSTPALAHWPSLHVVSCGHFIHFDCLRRYLSTQPHLLGQHTNQRVFPCPTCRRVSNALIPIPNFGSFSSSDAKAPQNMSDAGSSADVHMEANDTDYSQSMEELLPSTMQGWLQSCVIRERLNIPLGKGGLTSTNAFSLLPTVYMVVCEQLLRHLTLVHSLPIAQFTQHVAEQAPHLAPTTSISNALLTKYPATVVASQNSNNTEQKENRDSASHQSQPSSTTNSASTNGVSSTLYLDTAPSTGTTALVLSTPLSSFPLSYLPFRAGNCLVRMHVCLSIVGHTLARWELLLRHQLSVDKFGENPDSAGFSSSLHSKSSSSESEGKLPLPACLQILSCLPQLSVDHATGSNGWSTSMNRFFSHLSTCRSMRNTQLLRLLLFIYRTLRFLYLREIAAVNTTAEKKNDNFTENALHETQHAVLVDDYRDIETYWNLLLGGLKRINLAGHLTPPDLLAPLLSQDLFTVYVRMTALFLPFHRETCARVMQVLFLAKVLQSIVALTSPTKRSFRKVASVVSSYSVTAMTDTSRSAIPPLSGKAFNVTSSMDDIPMPSLDRSVSTGKIDDREESSNFQPSSSRRKRPRETSASADSAASPDITEPHEQGDPSTSSPDPVSANVIALLSTACLSDVCCLPSLYLFVLALRRGWVSLSTSYAEHLEKQKACQRACASVVIKSFNHIRAHSHHSTSSMDSSHRHSDWEESSPVWVRLVAFVPLEALRSSVEMLSSPCIRQIALYTHTSLNLKGELDNPAWYLQILPSLQSLCNPTDKDNCFAAEQLQLLYSWLQPFFDVGPALDNQSHRSEFAAMNSFMPDVSTSPAMKTSDSDSHFDENSTGFQRVSNNGTLITRSNSRGIPPLRNIPCVGLDTDAPLRCLGLPAVFQALLHPSWDRVCPHCRTQRSSSATGHHVSSLLLCVLCGEYVCATSRSRCHLLHVHECEGVRGVFLSIKRGDVVLLKLAGPLQPPSNPYAAAAVVTPVAATHPTNGGRAEVAGTNTVNDGTNAPATSGNPNTHLQASNEQRQAITIGGPGTPTHMNTTQTTSAENSAGRSPSYWFCHWPSLYLDQYGESDLNLSRGRPLYLSSVRCAALIELILSHHLDDYIHTHAYAQPLIVNQPPPTQPQHHIPPPPPTHVGQPIPTNGNASVDNPRTSM